MTCYHPLHAFNTGLLTAKEKPLYLIYGGNVESVPFTDKSLQRKLNNKGYSLEDLDVKSEFISKDPFNSFYRVKVGHRYDTRPLYRLTDYIEIPCGKCLGCRLKYSQEWAVRCLLEAEQYDHNYFITLTYNEDNYKKSLDKRDLTLFLKRLREHFRINENHIGIRYFAAGEYGEHTLRPHYHIIFFNLPLKDLDPLLFQVKDGNYIFRSELIEKLWPYGFSSIAEVSFKTAAYTARYCLKKIGKDDSGAEKLNLQPEFVVMSRRPGIAEASYKKHFKDYYFTDEIIYKNGEKVCSIKPPRYFDNFYSLEYPEIFEDIHNKRLNAAKLSRFNKLNNSHFKNQDELLSYLEMLKYDSIERNLKRTI